MSPTTGWVEAEPSLDLRASGADAARGRHLEGRWTLLAASVFVIYMVGSGRSYGYDASVTIDQFVRGGDPMHTLTHPYAQNNHIAFSILESVVWRLGGQSEVAQRVLPALCAAICVYVVATWLARRYSALAGMVSGLFIACAPMAVDQGRDVRGYSLAMLCVTAATLMIASEVRSSVAGPGPGDGALVLGASRRSVAVALLLGVAMGTHLFTVVALAGLATWIARTDRSQLVRWRGPIVAGCLLGAVIRLPTIGYSIGLTLHEPAGEFAPSFPAQLGRELLGRDVWGVGVLGVALAIGAVGFVRRRRLTPGLAAALAILASIAVIWSVLHPALFFPRFFVWLVPAIAISLGLLVHRRPVMAAPLLVAIALMAFSQHPTWTTDPLPNRQLAAALDGMELSSAVCAVDHSGESLLGYEVAALGLFDDSKLGRCAVLIVPAELEGAEVVAAAAAAMPFRRDFDDTVHPAFLLSRTAIPTA